MSLNDAERRRTSQELKANLAASGLSAREAAEDLGFTPGRLRSALDVGPSGDPVDVWELRDYLDQAVRDTGRAPVPWTVLTEPARHLTREWFPLRKPRGTPSRPARPTAPPAAAAPTAARGESGACETVGKAEGPPCISAASERETLRRDSDPPGARRPLRAGPSAAGGRSAQP
ncbi:DUF2316 family protein [Streptomyces similanensis]|uniref:DUF2316 family protein n=1 Tax=Streptomyces similanensis TaxID=1274988 RepID=A0ABP9KRI7_9ACTN